MSELPDSNVKLLPPGPASREPIRRTLESLGRQRSKLALGMSLAGLLIALPVVVQASTSLPVAAWWALALMAGGTACSIPWSKTTWPIGTRRLREIMQSPAAAALRSRTGAVLKPQILELIPAATWRGWWARTAWRARMISRTAVLLGIAFLAAWIMAPLTVLAYGIGTILAVFVARVAWARFQGQPTFYIPSRVRNIGSPRGVVLAAVLLLVALSAWQNWNGQASVVAQAPSPANAAPLVQPKTQGANGAAVSPAAAVADSSLQIATPLPAQTTASSSWFSLPAKIDLNLALVLAILLALAARQVGTAKLALQLRERLQPLIQTPGGIALGIIVVFLAFSLWHQPTTGAVLQSPSALGERKVLQAIITEKTKELTQLTGQLAPDEAHAAIAAEQGPSKQVLELSRVEKELADARYRLATLDSAGQTYGAAESKDTIDLTYWGHPSPTVGSPSSGSSTPAVAGAAASP
jgi:hypothetical protein